MKETTEYQSAGVPTIALIAHDAKKGELVDVLRDFLPLLKGCQLVATHSTGVVCASRLGLPVKLLRAGPFGGDQQMGALAAEDKLDALIFLRDPLTAQPHEPDISALLRVCDVHNVPLATNPATAQAILRQMTASLHGQIVTRVDGGRCSVIQRLEEQRVDDGYSRHPGLRNGGSKEKAAPVQAQVGSQEAGKRADPRVSSRLSVLLGEVGID